MAAHGVLPHVQKNAHDTRSSPVRSTRCSGALFNSNTVQRCTAQQQHGAAIHRSTAKSHTMQRCTVQKQKQLIAAHLERRTGCGGRRRGGHVHRGSGALWRSRDGARLRRHRRLTRALPRLHTHACAVEIWYCGFCVLTTIHYTPNSAQQ